MRSLTYVAIVALTMILVGPPPATAQDKPAITPEDYGKWESLGGASFSPDGKVLAYSINRVSGENELHLRILAADTPKVIAYGSRPTFSNDSQWVAYGIGLSEEARDKLQKSSQPVRNKMGLLDLTMGKTVEVENVASFSFSDDGKYLAMRGYPIDGKKSSGVDLIVRDLSTGIDTNFGNVSSFAWQDEGGLLAMAIDAEDKAGNGVQLFNPATGVLRTLDSAKATYKNLSWRRKADDLAFLRTKEDDAYEDETHTAIAFTGLGVGNGRKNVFDHTNDDDFPDGMRVVDFAGVRWADEGGTIFFGIKEWEKKPQEDEKAGEKKDPQDKEEGDDSDADKGKEKPKPDKKEEPSNVEIWHPDDIEIMPRQKVTANQGRRRNYLAAWHLESEKFVQLGRGLTERVRLNEGQKTAIAFDQAPYDQERMFGPAYNDVYLVDVKSGERTKVKEKVQYAYSVSPDGKYLLYLEDDHYYTYNFETGAHTNITSKAPTSFVNFEDDHTVKQKPPFGNAGWTKCSQGVLLYDKYDVWEVAPDGSTAINLTNAASDRIRCRLTRLDREERFYEHGKTYYASMYGEWSKKYGYARLKLGETPERLVFEDKNVGRLAKAKDAEVYAYMVQDYDDSPDYMLAGPDLSDGRQITETNAFQKDYAWGRSELIEFENVHGKKMQGALFYPANYEPGKKYPMITYIYEIRSNVVHGYTTPSERSPYNTTVFTSRGYFLFQPDIVYRDRNPGLSAVECVVPAVEKVLETGMIDPDRVGLVGHSWGAYQTSFIITQTDMFSAAVAGAPLTDLISMYLSIYWNSGGTDARIFEISQGRMEVPPWEDLNSYMDNSALFSVKDLNTPLLMTFGDKDGAVDWHQGIELYNAARREGKQLVMLVYPGENHSLRQKPNQLDYHRRIINWFGHYLKGNEAEDWIHEGKSFLDREKELKKAGGSGDDSGGQGGGRGRGRGGRGG